MYKSKSQGAKMQGKQITLEDIQKDRVLHASIVEKCDLITRLYIELEDVKKENETLKKEQKKDEEK